jgi:Flp pilus assembly pilin Flp
MRGREFRESTMEEVSRVSDIFTRWYIQLATFAKNEDGQTMAEYGIILVVLALVAAVAFAALSGDISAALGKVGAKLNPAP